MKQCLVGEKMKTLLKGNDMQGWAAIYMVLNFCLSSTHLSKGGYVFFHSLIYSVFSYFCKLSEGVPNSCIFYSRMRLFTKKY